MNTLAVVTQYERTQKETIEIMKKNEELKVKITDNVNAKKKLPNR
jgi:hypothetical protein